MRKAAAGLIGVASLLAATVFPGALDPSTAGPPRAPAVSAADPLPARPNTIRNPIRENAADPWVVHAEGNYNLVYTHGDKLVGVAAPSVAGLGAATTQTLWQPSPGEACCNLWAPELHQFNGKWYLYYTADNGTDSQHRMFVLEADHPMGPYSNNRKLDTGDFHSIDGTVLKLPDGRLYHVWSSGRADGQNTYIAPMSNPWTISGPPSLIARPDQPWEQRLRKVTEAPVALIRDGKVYLYYSASACESPDYQLGVLELTGTDVLAQSSWTKSSGPVFRRNDAGWVFGTGHNGFFTSPDGTETWIVYHGVTSSNGSVTGSCSAGRSVRIGKVTFDAAGKPQLGVPAASWQTVTMPSGDPGADIVADGVYTFTPRNNLSNRLEVFSCSTANAANVQVWKDISSCQNWRVTYLGDGSYKITAVHSGLALDVAGCSAANHADVIQWPYWGGDCQEWYLDAVGGGFHKVISKVGGKALDVDACSTLPEADVRVWPYWQGDCQQWKLVKVG